MTMARISLAAPPAPSSAPQAPSPQSGLPQSLSHQTPSRWIKQWLDKPENVFMCSVDETFIRDRFNLIDLDERVPDFETAVNIILDETVGVEVAVRAGLAAELLYGLVHARFVMTPRGIAKMLEKYMTGCFGKCPRVNCEYSSVLPIGLSDVAGDNLVKIYCPRCMDVYNPAIGSKGMNIDGAYFGTGFPHMVFMTRPEYRPPRPKGRHVSKLYGFRVHKIAGDLQRHEAIEYRRSLLSNNATNARAYSTARESTSTMPTR